MQFHFATIAAFKIVRNVSLKRQAAPIAKRRLDNMDIFAATRADVSLRSRGAARPAKLAYIGINEAQGGVSPGGQSHAPKVEKVRPCCQAIMRRPACRTARVDYLLRRSGPHVT
jgi:hypothetical protein